ncbi:MAG: hypothetical protein IKT38_02490 [Clostridia bacterium]|nr:hypothetical protein [Clostridia bacterium]
MTVKMAKSLNDIFKWGHNRTVAALIVMAIIISLLSGCNSEVVTNKYRLPPAGAFLQSGEVYTNDNYSLSWDDEAKSVQIKCLKTGKVWSNISYEMYQEGSTSVYANSSMIIKVVDSTLLVEDTITSYAALMDGGQIIAQKLDNGVRVIYYFDVQKISIPVDYILEEDSLTVTVKTEMIREGDSGFILAEFAPTPLLCSSANDNQDGYLFVPSGQGALMNTDITPDGARKWSGEVYGDDVSMLRTETMTNTVGVRLPVFGAKDGNNGIFGIIESAAGNSAIVAEAGNHKMGRSAVYPEFFVRGHDSYWHGSQIYGQSILTQHSKDIDKYTAKIRYYFLDGESADYNGMAKLYRDYLKTNNKLVKSNLDYSPYAISYIGGTNVNNSILGIPTTELVALTTFNDAKDSVEKITSSVGAAPYVRLLNFGDGGLTPSTYLGGKNIKSVYGKSSDLSELLDLIKNNKTKLFFDFDLVYFGKSGNGVKISADSAKTAIKYDSEKKESSPNRIFDEKAKYYVISRNELSSGLEKTLKKADKFNLDALSLATISNSLYSDYGYENSSRTSMEKQVADLILKAKKEKAVASSDANAFCAGISDVIFEVSCENDDALCFSNTIPFYQMIFSGYVPMYSQSINFAPNSDKALAMAASSGIGLGFTLTGKYNSQSNDFDTYKLYATPREYNENKIENILNADGYIDYFSKISNASLERYEILENGVSLSVFSNGVKVYANHTEKSCESPIGMLSAYEFNIGEAE